MADALSRRTVLAGALAGAGAVALGRVPGAAAACEEPACPRTPQRSRDRLVQGGAFRHGVASGHPTERAVTLWSRVDGIERSGALDLEIARDPGFGDVVHTQRVRAAQVRDYVVRARVGEGLRPGEQYFYRFATRGVDSPVGRFVTARPRDSREPVRIGFFSCQDYQAGFYTAHAGLAQEPDLDLIVSLGDYIYERTFYEGPDARRDATGANGDAEVQTLPEYRAKYQLYRSDPNLQAMHAAAPFMAIMDDHDVEDNWAAEQPGEATLDPRVDFLDRRRNAFLAYREWMPFGRVDCPEPNRFYRHLRLGANAEIFLLDTRQYRDDQPCGDQFFVPCGESTQPGRTMLGERQKAWLKDRLAASDATWKVLANQIMLMALDLPLGNPINPDQWDGYAAERAELMQFVADNDIANVTAITGDIHTFFAGLVTTTGRVGGRPAATEFVGGSITSLGVPETLGFPPGDRSRDAALLTERLETQNPHIKSNNHAFRGYGVLECRPDELLCTFRGPASTMVEQSPTMTLARFRVPRDQLEVEVLQGNPNPLGVLVA
jgi:alkaline phosphatase D